jgi:hypothetical protein
MNAIRFQLIRQNRAIRAKKMNENRRKEQIKRGVNHKLKKPTPVVDESKWNMFYVLLKKEIEKSEYAGHFIQLLSDINTVYNKYYKFYLIKKCNENIFISQTIKDDFLSCFSKAQKKYNSLARLQYLYLFHKATFRNDQDTLLAPIDSTMQNIIIVFHGKSKYLFRNYEMNKLIKSALCNHDEFDTAVPLPCKNPYNNIPFSKAQLINIYNQMLYSTQQIDPLVSYYYNNGFNLKLFHHNYYSNMNQQYIKDKYDNLYTRKQVIHQVKEMVNYIDDITNGDIHFPKNDDMYMDLKPYLKLYYLSEYSTDEFTRHRSLQELKYRLKKILRENPKYGKRSRKATNVFTPQDPDAFLKEIAEGNFLCKPAPKKYEHTTNIKRTPFHYNNVLEGFATSHENNSFVNFEEFPYDDIVVHTDHRHRRFIDDEDESEPSTNLPRYNEESNSNQNNTNDIFMTSVDSFINQMIQNTNLQHPHLDGGALINNAIRAAAANTVWGGSTFPVVSIPTTGSFSTPPRVNEERTILRIRRQRTVEEGEIMDGDNSNQGSEEEKDNT